LILPCVHERASLVNPYCLIAHNLRTAEHK
jgi:hypothetical protein